MNGILVFDLDGTLVDSLPAIAASLNRAMVASGREAHPERDVRRFIGDGSRMLVKRALGDSDDEAAIDELEALFKTDYAATWPQGTPVFDGIFDLLDQLRTDGWKLAVLSNKPHGFTTEIVATLFPEIAFDAVLGQRAGIPHKPAPDGIHEILDLTGCAPADCWLIGDSTIDLATAKNAGIRSFAVAWGYHDRDVLFASEPDAMADTPADIHALLSTRPFSTFGSCQAAS